MKCNLFIHLKSVLYCVNFEVINNGFSHAHMLDSPCIIAIQVGILSFIFLTSFGGFCYHLGVVLCPF